MSIQKLTQNPEDLIIINSAEDDQIFGDPPGWILKWGISLVLVAVIIFGLIAWLIKYPDVVNVSVDITTENPPIAVIAKSSGELTSLFVKNNEELSKGAIIGVLDNPAKMGDVNALENFIDTIISIKDPRLFLKVKPPEDFELGNIQDSYAALVQKIEDFQFFLKQSGVFKKIESYEKQIENTHLLSEVVKNRKNKFIGEISMIKKDLKRNRQLNKDGIVSDSNLEKIETQFSQHLRQLDAMQSEVINNNMSIEQYKVQILDLSQNRMQGVSSREINIKENIEKIKNEIEVWKKSKLIIAPIDGKVSFSKVWNEQQFVRESEEVLTIVPDKGLGKIIGKGLVPISESGRIREGQGAKIQIYGYPYQEFGIIKATVSNVSLVPTSIVPDESNYILEFNIPDSLITTYDRTIPFKQKMQGEASIITEDRRVLDRVFDKLISIIKN